MAKAKKQEARTGKVFLNLEAVASNGKKVQAGAILIKEEHLVESKALQALYEALVAGKAISWQVRPVLLEESDSEVSF